MKSKIFGIAVMPAVSSFALKRMWSAFVRSISYFVSGIFCMKNTLDKPDIESVITGMYLRSAQYGAAIAIVVLVAGICYPLTSYIGYKTVSLILLMTVMLLPLWYHRGPVLAAAATGALAWNFLFIPPLFTFTIGRPEDVIMLGVFLVVALITGSLSARVRERELAISAREKNASALYELTRDLSSAHSQDEVIKAAVRHLGAVFEADVAAYLGDIDGDIGSLAHPASTWIPGEDLSNSVAMTYWNEKRVFRPAHLNRIPETIFLVMSGPRYALGVIGIRLRERKKLDARNEILLENFIAQIASAVERELLNEMSKRTVVIAESERLYGTLFNSLSHELRTPLATILGASENLLRVSEWNTGEQRELAAEIHTAADRLNRLVANLLDMSRLESGTISPKLDWCDLTDILHLCVQQLEPESEGHRITIDVQGNMPLARLDFGLIEQALTNLVHNAIVHTPEGTLITVRATASDDRHVITVTDNGPGIRPEDMTDIFRKFYRGGSARTGGTGLGLPIAKGFIEAHHGTLGVRNILPHGAEFVIELPMERKSVVL